MYGFNRVVSSVVRTAGDSIYNFTKDAINNFSELERQHAKTMGAMATDYEKTAEAHGMQLKKADFDSLNLCRHSLEGQVFDCGDYKDIHLPLLGDHQLHNAAVVLATVETLQEIGWKITKENIFDGIRDVSWPER